VNAMNKPCDHEWGFDMSDDSAICGKCSVRLDADEYKRYVALKKRMQALIDGATNNKKGNT